jgi:hypothetical protein
MGQDVLCQGCGKRLAIEDFTMGAAQTIGNRSYCRPCMPASEVKTILSPTPPPAVPQPPKRSPALMLGAAGVAVLAVLAAVVVFRPPKPASTSTTPSAAPRQSLETELEALKIRAGQPLIEERFGAAISMLREARKNHDEPEWTRPIDQRLRELQLTADGLYAQLVDQAVEARKRGGLAEVEKIRQRIAQWELPIYSTSLEQALSAIRIPDPVPGYGLRLIPGLGDAGRVHRRYGTSAEKGVEAVPFGTGRAVGFEGDLFQTPSDGDIQATIVTPTAQSFQIRLAVVGERGRTVTYEYAIRNVAAGTPVQVRAPFNRFTDGGRTLPGGSIVKQLHLLGQDSKVAFRVTELAVVKRRD